jgi:hypothetical protein
LYCFCDEINAHLILPIGIAPSPYDLVYSLPKSETDTSISSGWFLYFSHIITSIHQQKKSNIYNEVRRVEINYMKKMNLGQNF